MKATHIRNAIPAGIQKPIVTPYAIGHRLDRLRGLVSANQRNRVDPPAGITASHGRQGLYESLRQMILFTEDKRPCFAMFYRYP